MVTATIWADEFFISPRISLSLSPIPFHRSHQFFFFLWRLHNYFLLFKCNKKKFQFQFRLSAWTVPRLSSERVSLACVNISSFFFDSFNFNWRLLINLFEICHHCVLQLKHTLSDDSVQADGSIGRCCYFFSLLFLISGWEKWVSHRNIPRERERERGTEA